MKDLLRIRFARILCLRALSSKIICGFPTLVQRQNPNGVLFRLLEPLKGNSKRTPFHKKLHKQYPDLLVKTDKVELESRKFSHILAMYLSLLTSFTMDESTPNQIYFFANDLVFNFDF
jgi:hypothetical protein